MAEFQQTATPNATVAANTTPFKEAPDPLKGGRPQYEGYWTPFRAVPAGPAGPARSGIPGIAYIMDARNQQVPADTYKRWVADGKPHYPDKSGTPEAAAANPAPMLPGTNPGDVNAGDVKTGTQVYRDAVPAGRDVYGRILARTGDPDPSAIDFFNKNRVTPQNVQASTITGPRDLQGVQQQATTIEDTNLADLQATARGEGAGQTAAKARSDQFLFRQGQQASGQIQGARGFERRGLRRALLGAQSEQAVAAGKNLAEIDAATSLQAQQQVAQFDARRKEAQANLDAARLSGDAERIQRAETEMATLEQAAKQFSAQQTQAAAVTNAANTLNAGTTNLTQGMAAIEQDFDTWKQTNELALEAQKALEASAQGLLNEDQRQQSLAMARAQLALEQRKLDEMIRANARQEQLQAQQQKLAFWGTMITSLLAKVPVPGKPAAHGGVVDKATQLLVGEAGDAEIVIPIKGNLSERMLSMLSVDSKPFVAAGPSGQIDNMGELTKAIKATLRTAPETNDDMTSMLASATLRARRAR